MSPSHILPHPIATFEELFGCRRPLQQAGMGGTSGPALAAAVSTAGALGMLAMPGASPDELQDLIAQTQALTTQPFGVNFLMPMLDRECVAVAARGATAVEFFWGQPERELVETVHLGGSRAGWQVGSVAEARRAADAGCDYIIAQGVEAGGHVSASSSLWSLLDTIIPDMAIPVIAAGGIGSRSAVRAALATGATGVRVGTRFVATNEADVHPSYVDALIGAQAADTTLTTAFGVGWPNAPHRVLQSSIDAGDRLMGTTEVVGEVSFGDITIPVPLRSPMSPGSSSTGNVEAMAMYAGFSVDDVHRRASAAEVVAELMG